MSGLEADPPRRGVSFEVIPQQESELIIAPELRADQRIVHTEMLSLYPDVPPFILGKMEEFDNRFPGQKKTIAVLGLSGGGKGVLIADVVGGVLMTPDESDERELEENTVLVSLDQTDEAISYIATKTLAMRGAKKGIVKFEKGKQPDITEVMEAASDVKEVIAVDYARASNDKSGKKHFLVAELVPVVTEDLVRYLAANKTTIALFLITNIDSFRRAYKQRVDKLTGEHGTVFDMPLEEAVETMGYAETMEVICAEENRRIGEDYRNGKFIISDLPNMNNHFDILAWEWAYRDMTEEEKEDFFRDLAVFDRENGEVAVHPLRPAFQEAWYRYRAESYGLTTGYGDNNPDCMFIRGRFYSEEDGVVHAQPEFLKNFDLLERENKVVELKEGKDTVIS